MKRPIRERKRDGSCKKFRRFFCGRYWEKKICRCGRALKRRFRGIFNEET
jgi:hypothetical protein